MRASRMVSIVLAVVAHGVGLDAAFWGAFSSFSSLYQFPSLSEGLLAIIGISHAAKLVEQNTTPAATP
jgi:hypothetical protein